MRGRPLNQPTEYEPNFWSGLDKSIDEASLATEFREGTSKEAGDILCLGCSFTSGHAIPAELSWPHMIGIEKGLTVDVYAETGIGYVTLENWLVQYLAERGIPSHILILGPDFQRLQVNMSPETNDVTDVRLNWDPIGERYWANGSDKFKLRQFDGRKIPPHHSIITGVNIDALQRIRMIARAVKANFSVSTWWGQTHRTLTELDFPDYEPLSMECGHQPLNETQKTWWEHSLDGNHGGMHDQIHFAETFLGEQLSQTTLEKLGAP